MIPIFSCNPKRKGGWKKRSVRGSRKWWFDVRMILKYVVYDL
ncbi:unnamed protein product, partial [Larinioides sclopetarius]